VGVPGSGLVGTTSKVGTNNVTTITQGTGNINFILSPSLIAVDYFVVAGGGGGSATGAGAGGIRSTVGATGGGGSLESPILLLPETNYTVTVGAGGTGAADGQVADGTNGVNSTFAGITSIGGGAGKNSGNPQLNIGIAGGSGSGSYAGGDGTNNGTRMPGGVGIAGQGYAGGRSALKAGGTSSTGGGGGAGAIGGTASSPDVAGVGGDGISTNISGSSVSYGGGGGGGIFISGSAKAGGVGGGGLGSTGNSAGSSGSANTGGGAGGYYSAAYKNAAYSGGSGIVILRYPSTNTLTVGAGLVADAPITVGANKVTRITAGTGTISIS
jgi:hypothetical protein